MTQRQIGKRELTDITYFPLSMEIEITTIYPWGLNKWQGRGLFKIEQKPVSITIKMKILASRHKWVTI